MPDAHYLKIEKSARFYLSGPLKAQYRGVCFALHGQGQLAQFFIHPFKTKSLSEILFIAPEGLHRYYLEGAKGRVGASWMTKEDRLRDIEDYCGYLDTVWDHIIPHLNLKEPHNIGVLGFSQGVATACRWLSYTQHQFSYLINYAGIYPPDLPEKEALDKMQRIPVQHLLGDEDEYITVARMNQSLAEFSEKGFPAELHVFKGSHRIYPEVLERSFRELAAID